MLLRVSPSPALAACHELCESYEPLARKLFNSAFLSCWQQLDEGDQNTVARGLVKAMAADPGVMQVILSVADFMSHHAKEMVLPIDPVVLGEMAIDCRAYAKALRYKENELRQFFDRQAINRGENPAAVTCTPQLLKVAEDLITIYQALDLPDSAHGLLVFLGNYTSLKESDFPPSW